MDDSLFIEDEKPQMDDSLFIDEDTETPEQRLERIKQEPGIVDTTVDDYLSISGLPALGKAAAKGAVNLAGKVLPKNTAKYAEDVATKMFNNQMGATLKQGRQVGEELADETAKLGYEKGLMKPFTGAEGARDIARSELKNTGKAIGEARRAGGSISQKEVLERLKGGIGDKLTGVRAAEAPGYNKAVEEVTKMGPQLNARKLADKATFLNKYAKKNAEALGQTKNPMTDVANELSKLSTEMIVRKLGPEKAQEYLKSLSEYQKMKTALGYLNAGQLRDKFGRGSISSFGAAKNAVMNTVGNKLVGNTAHNVAEALRMPLSTMGPSKSKAAEMTLAEWLKQQADK